MTVEDEEKAVTYTRLKCNTNTWEKYMVKESTDGFMLDPFPLEQLKLSNGKM